MEELGTTGFSSDDSVLPPHTTGFLRGRGTVRCCLCSPTPKAQTPEGHRARELSSIWGLKSWAGYQWGRAADFISASSRTLENTTQQERMPGEVEEGRGPSCGAEGADPGGSSALWLRGLERPLQLLIGIRHVYRSLSGVQFTTLCSGRPLGPQISRPQPVSPGAVRGADAAVLGAKAEPWWGLTSVLGGACAEHRPRDRAKPLPDSSTAVPPSLTQQAQQRLTGLFPRE